jgi:hypothetical protein
LKVSVWSKSLAKIKSLIVGSVITSLDYGGG